MASTSPDPLATADRGHRDISLNLIHASTNVRTNFDPQKLNELAKSIKDKGILQPLIVRPHPTKRNHFQLVIGERRWRASRIAAMGSVPCEVRQLTDDQVDEIQLIENDQREDLTPLERAAGYKKMIDRGNTPETLAAKVRKSSRFIYEMLSLLRLPASARDALARGEMCLTTAELVAKLPNEQLRENAAEQIIRSNYTGAPLSVRLARAHIERNFMRELKGAPFDRTSATLVPRAGSCDACPKRTGNNRSDFPEGRADICTDPPCYSAKIAAAEKLSANVRTEDRSGAPAPQAKPSTAAAVEAMRARFSESKRRRASELVQRLSFLKTEFTEPEFNEILQVAITGAERLARSSRRSDRDLLLHELEQWEALEIEEIVEGTGLSRWVAETNLKELAGKGLVRIQTKDDPKKSGGRPRLIYSLIHTTNQN